MTLETLILLVASLTILLPPLSEAFLAALRRLME
jgi:hypothetical protein